jgi:hypothetical protein
VEMGLDFSPESPLTYMQKGKKYKYFCAVGRHWVKDQLGVSGPQIYIMVVQ